jgi:uncharacterized protein
MMKALRGARRSSGPRRLLVPIALLAVFALLLAACGDADDDDGDVAAPDDTEEPDGTDDTDDTDDADAEWPDEIVFMTGSTGGSWQALGAALGAVIEDEMDLRVDVQAGAGPANLIGIQQGDAQIALSNAFAYVEALEGEGDWEDQPIDDVVHMLALNIQMFQMWVQANTDIQSIDDVPGHALATLGQGSAGEAGVADVLDVHGISYDDLSRVEFGSAGDMVDFMSDRQVDIAANVAPLPASYYIEMAASQDIRLIGVDPDRLAELQERNAGYIPDVIPGGTYEGEDEDVDTFSTSVHIVTSRQLPADFIEELSRVIADNADSIRAVADAFSEVTSDAMGRDLGLEMHPGAEAYFGG